MNIHNKIRNEIIDLIRNALPSVDNYFNGRVFLTGGIKEQLPAVSVYLSDAKCEVIALSGVSEWSADLNIGILIPFNQGEEKLDEIAEVINNLIKFDGYENIISADPASYDYEYDDDGIWLAGLLTYSIKYQRDSHRYEP
ncbi:phage tail terminator protein [Lonepinella sp. BR2904]|uniref:phage tail terminator protein n=1 Tax=Lonepinella sp. BR2904 TaxID=3434551 RepID=UPI003F6E3BB0